MAEYIVPECGDCLHASLCETLPLSQFNRENPAYCKAFKPAANMVDVVRCKDCKHYRDWGDGTTCMFWTVDWDVPVTPDDYCSYGAKMDGKGEG